MRVVQIEPGPCPTLIASAPQSARNSTPAALVTFPAMMGNFGNASRKTFTVSPTPLVWPCAVETAIASTPRSTSAPTCSRILFLSSSPNALRVAETAAPQIRRKFAIARGLELRRAFLRDALHVAQRDESAQFVLVVHDEQFVDAEMLGEKFVGARNRVFAQVLFA